jgi:hypothetical protein
MTNEQWINPQTKQFNTKGLKLFLRESIDKPISVVEQIQVNINFINCFLVADKLQHPNNHLKLVNICWPYKAKIVALRYLSQKNGQCTEQKEILERLLMFYRAFVGDNGGNHPALSFLTKYNLLCFIHQHSVMPYVNAEIKFWYINIQRIIVQAKSITELSPIVDSIQSKISTVNNCNYPFMRDLLHYLIMFKLLDELHTELACVAIKLLDQYCQRNIEALLPPSPQISPKCSE